MGNPQNFANIDKLENMQHTFSIYSPGIFYFPHLERLVQVIDGVACTRWWRGGAGSSESAPCGTTPTYPVSAARRVPLGQRAVGDVARVPNRTTWPARPNPPKTGYTTPPELFFH